MLLGRLAWPSVSPYLRSRHAATIAPGRVLGMETAIVGALIVGGCAIVAAVIQLRGRKPSESALSASEYQLIGNWQFDWWYREKPDEVFSDFLSVTRHEGFQLSGYLFENGAPLKRWDFQGRFDGRFLQTLYYPAKESGAEFVSTGCNLLERKGRGFEGWNLAYDYRRDCINAVQCRLRRVN